MSNSRKIKDLYALLGVTRDANEDQIRKAFREQGSKFHPDKNKEKDAEEKFKELSFAYHTLTDEVKRAKYDALFAPPVDAEVSNSTYYHRPSSSSGESVSYKPQDIPPSRTNPFHVSDEDKRDMEDLFGAEWQRMYSESMAGAAERYDKFSSNLEGAIANADKKTEETMKRINDQAEEMLRRIWPLDM